MWLPWQLGPTFHSQAMLSLNVASFDRYLLGKYWSHLLHFVIAIAKPFSGLSKVGCYGKPYPQLL